MSLSLKHVAVSCLAAVLVIGFSPTRASADWQEEVKIIGEALQIIENDYLWPIDFTKCRYDMMKVLTRRTVPVARTEEEAKKEAENEFVCLDRFSGFYTPEETRAFLEDMEGHLAGVGIEIESKKGAVVVVAPLEGSPAAHVGIQTDDVLIAARQESEEAAVLIKDATSAAKMIRGPIGTKVYLTIGRNGRTLEFELTRTTIKTSAVTKKNLPGGFGYVRIGRFTETAADDFDLAMRSFANESSNPGVVLDLRDNPGGLLMSAIEFLYMLSDKPSDIILTTRERNGELPSRMIGDPGFMFLDLTMCSDAADQRTCPIRSPGKYKNYEIVVLINGKSASASELVAGTMKDWGYEIVADLHSGGRSRGKGVGQTIKQLSDGSSLHLTTFEYMVGNSKTAVHEVGIAGSVSVKDERTRREDMATEKDAMVMKALELLSK